MANNWSAVVENSSHDCKVGGLSQATTIGTEREKMAKSFLFEIDQRLKM